MDAVREALANPATDVNETAADGFTPLISAIMKHTNEYNNLDIIRLLLDRPDLDVNKRHAVWEDTALMRAVMKGHDKMEIIRLLLARPDIDVNIVDSYHSTALMNAIYTGNLEIPRLLLTRPELDVNVSDMHGWTALMRSVLIKNDIINDLLNHPNIDMNLVNTNGRTALDLAIDFNYTKNADILYKKMATQQPRAHLEIVVKMPVPANETDIISWQPILNGTLMVDFHGERAFGRYYMKDSYEAIHPKRNPMTSKPISRSEVVFYIAEVPEV